MPDEVIINTTEFQDIETFIHTTLSNSGDIGVDVYPYFAPQGADFPCVVFNLQTPKKDLMTLGTDRIMTNLMYQIKVIGKDCAFEDVDEIAANIDILLHGSSGTNGNLVITRDNPISYIEVANGVNYMHRGALYNIKISKTKEIILDLPQ